jgi:hypothetical protein
MKNLAHGPIKSKERMADAQGLILNEMLYNHHGEPISHIKSSSHINDDCSMRNITAR